MRFRVALTALVVFAVVDFAQGLGAFDAHSTQARAGSARGELITYAPAADAPVPTAASPVTVPPTSVPTAAPEAPAATVPTTLPPPATTSPPAAPPDAVVARVVASTLTVFADPGDRAPTLVLPARTEFGNPRVLLATEQRGAWVRVMLPVRPNGWEAWVPASAVTLSTVPDVIDVDLAAHRLTWARHGAIMRTATVAVGAPSTPTPPGTYFVTDVLPSDPIGPRGAWILALNGHSDALTEFDGGDPRIAIHGTNEPATIGRSVSSGCVRADPQTLVALASAIAPGTPVVIH
jgi:lipoprotein-anchoring transpeptidase ErfK/SrfK